MNEAVYPSLEPIGFLLGTWRGKGEGTWPSSGDFTYEEEMTFELGGGGDEFGFITYSERAWNPAPDGGGETLHAERGFWMLEDGLLTVALAHPIAVTEISEGSVSAGVIELEAKRLVHGTNGLPVTAYRRRYVFASGAMTYEQQMAAGDAELTTHLRASLRRVSG